MGKIHTSSIVLGAVFLLGVFPAGAWAGGIGSASASGCQTAPVGAGYCCSSNATPNSSQCPNNAQMFISAGCSGAYPYPYKCNQAQSSAAANGSNSAGSNSSSTSPASNSAVSATVTATAPEVPTESATISGMIAGPIPPGTTPGQIQKDSGGYYIGSGDNKQYVDPGAMKPAVDLNLNRGQVQTQNADVPVTPLAPAQTANALSPTSAQPNIYTPPGPSMDTPQGGTYSITNGSGVGTNPNGFITVKSATGDVQTRVDCQTSGCSDITISGTSQGDGNNTSFESKNAGGPTLASLNSDGSLTSTSPITAVPAAPVSTDQAAIAQATAQGNAGMKYSKEIQSLINQKNGTGGVGESGGIDGGLHEYEASGTDDPCKTGMSIANSATGLDGQKYACGGTQKLMETSTITSMVGQVAGSTVINQVGMQQQQNLLMNGATQAQSMQAAASLGMKAGELQTALGGMTTYMGYQENSSGKKLSNNANDFKAASQQATYRAGTHLPAQGSLDATITPADKLAQGVLPGIGYSAQGTTAPITAWRYAAQAGVQARTEQQAVASKASTQGFMDMVKGAVTMVQGVSAIAAAKQEESLANKLANAPSGILPPGADPFGNTPQGAGGSAVITGNGLNPNAIASPGVASAMPGASLGSPLGGPPGGGLNGAAPAAGAFGAPAPGGAPGGASGAGGGSSATAPSAPGSDAEPTAKYADSGRGGGVYEGGGGAPAGGGGKAGTESLSLKDAFAAMMGQNGEKKDDSGTDIRNFRGIASDAPFAPLAQSEDVFKYIHMAYEGLQKKGRIGL
jgi:hypothetical protein